MVSDRMANGNINDFVKAHPDANLLELVCLPFTTHTVSASVPLMIEFLI